ncbi:hypothetical protein C8R47DRAFT_1202348 [Mycena vitilis]|nr:hypothetical protein C8R47DRAFT_1202348 [Mycena vitilis]
MVGGLSVWDLIMLYMARVDTYLTSGADICPDVVKSRRIEREAIQNHYLRRALGLTERSVVAVLFSETGLEPISYRRALLLLRNLRYIAHLDIERLVKNGLIDSWNLARQYKMSWVNDVVIVLSELPIPVYWDVQEDSAIAVETIDSLIADVKHSMEASINAELRAYSRTKDLLTDRVVWLGPDEEDCKVWREVEQEKTRLRDEHSDDPGLFFKTLLIKEKILGLLGKLAYEIFEVFYNEPMLEINPALELRSTPRNWSGSPTRLFLATSLLLSEPGREYLTPLRLSAPLLVAILAFVTANHRQSSPLLVNANESILNTHRSSQVLADLAEAVLLIGVDTQPIRRVECAVSDTIPTSLPVFSPGVASMRPNFRYGPRGACTITNCPQACVGFVGENADGSPTNYTDFADSDVACFICEHTWMAHAPPELSTQNRVFARGGAGNGHCVAFWSSEPVWNMRLTCVCGRPWAVHQIIRTASSEPTTSTPQAATPAPAPAAAPTTAAAPIAAHRPVTAFAGLARPTTASVQNLRHSIVDSVQQQRRASIQRTLHPNTLTSAAGPSTSSTTISPNRRKSGNPRPYSKAAATPTLDDFAAAPVVSSVKLTVGILPKVLETSDYNDTLDPSPRYTWKGGDDLERAQLALKRANLVFEVDVDVTGPIFEAIDLAFRAHCQAYNISVVAATSAPGSVETPNTMSWILLGPRGRSGGRTWGEDPKSLTRFTFTLQALRSIPFSYTPNNLGEVPRLKNLHGPIDCLFDPAARLPNHVLIHTCLARRVLRNILASLDGDPNPVCGPTCPPGSAPAVRAPSPDEYVLSDSDDDVHFPEAEALIDQLVRDGLPPLSHADTAQDSPMPLAPSTSSSTIVTRSVHRQQWQEEAAATAMPVSRTALFIPGPLLTSAMELTRTSIKPRSFLGTDGALDLTLQHMPGPGAYSFSAWQDHILFPRELGERVSIDARSVDEGARALITLCFWLSAGRPTGLKFKEVVQEQFPPPRPSIDGVMQGEQGLFGLNVSIGRGIGKSPRNEVVAQAVKILMADGHYWTERETYQTLRLHPSHGPIPVRACVLKATGLLFLLHFLFIGAPIPASPFLFSTLFDGRNTASKFDPEFLSRFISPSSMSFVRKLAQTLLHRPMYASQSNDCIEYQFMVNIPGFDVEQNGVCASVWFATPCRELILTAFDREIKAVGDVLSHLEYTELNPENDVWGENEETVRLIEGVVTHYLQELGHPVDRDQVIDALIDDEFDATDPLFRVKLFLSVLTGSTLLPIRPSWKLKPTTDPVNGADDYGPDVTVSFRSCFKTFSITNNARLRHLLLNEPPVAGQDTQLGRLIHAQLLAGSFKDFSVKNQKSYKSCGFAGKKVVSAFMSRAPTRHSRRLGGHPASPQPELPARARTIPFSYADGCGTISAWCEHPFGPPYNGYFSDPPLSDAFQLLNNSDQFLSDTQQCIDNIGNLFSGSSSPSYPLGPITESPTSSPSTNLGSPSPAVPLFLHSPQAGQPSSRSISASSEVFGLHPAFSSQSDSPGSAGTGASPSPSLEEEPMSPPLLPVMPLNLRRQEPPRGSLAHLRLCHARTPAPAPAPSLGAVYVGFPFQENHARRNFFQTGLDIRSSTPTVTELIRVLRGSAHPVAQLLNDLCTCLDTQPFNVAWSRHLVEVLDPSYSAVINGYCEVGPLRAHLHSSQVVVEPARHNATSRAIFDLHRLPEGTPLFVLYIFPVVRKYWFISRLILRNLRQNIGMQRRLPPPVQAPSSSLPPVPHPASHTPSPTGASTVLQFLSTMLKTHSALDHRFQDEGFQLSRLSKPTYKGAYLKIRQTLIIENVFSRAQGIIPLITLFDVAGWAGLNPSTYSNNRTFARQARATLQFLRARGEAYKVVD